VDKEFTIGLFGWSLQPRLADQVSVLLEHSAFSLRRFPDNKEPASGSADALIFLLPQLLQQSRPWSGQWPLLFLGETSALLQVGVVGQGYSCCLLSTDAPGPWDSRLLEALQSMTAADTEKRRFRFTPDPAQVWSLVFDRKGVVRRAGEAWSEFAVAERTETFPPVWELLNLDAKRWEMCWNAVSTGAKVCVNDHPVVRPDGHLVYLDWDLVPGTQVGYGAAAAVFFGRDVSARIRAEEERVKVEKERAWLQKDMDQFVEAASHDLKEPLRNVANFVQLLQHRYGEQLAGEGADYIAYAVGGVRRMWHLMDDLLLFGNLNKALDRYGWTAPADLLADAMIQLDQPGPLSTQNLPDQVFGHPAQLALLFKHLLDNGFRYNPESDRVVGVECVEERSNWIISVWDNGPGIAAKYQQRAFSLFKRLHGQQEIPGRGMGLSICRKVMELHGGNIRLTSEMGKGTALHLWLPKPEPSATRVEQRRGV